MVQDGLQRPVGVARLPDDPHLVAVGPQHGPQAVVDHLVVVDGHEPERWAPHAPKVRKMGALKDPPASHPDGEGGFRHAAYRPGDGLPRNPSAAKREGEAPRRAPTRLTPWKRAARCPTN
nr:hypothetical protein GCM10020093_053960 [Planobispora longispora]